MFLGSSTKMSFEQFISLVISGAILIASVPSFLYLIHKETLFTVVSSLGNKPSVLLGLAIPFVTACLAIGILLDFAAQVLIDRFLLKDTLENQIGPDIPAECLRKLRDTLPCTLQSNQTTISSPLSCVRCAFMSERAVYAWGRRDELWSYYAFATNSLLALIPHLLFGPTCLWLATANGLLAILVAIFVLSLLILLGLQSYHQLRKVNSMEFQVAAALAMWNFDKKEKVKLPSEVGYPADSNLGNHHNINNA